MQSGKHIFTELHAFDVKFRGAGGRRAGGTHLERAWACYYDIELEGASESGWIIRAGQRLGGGMRKKSDEMKEVRGKKTRKRSNRRRVNENAWQSVVGARNGFVDMYSVASRASAQQRTAILLQAPRCCHRALAAHCSARRLQRSAQNRAGGRSLARGGRQAGRAGCGWWTTAGG